jgi:hypothetical protein
MTHATILHAGLSEAAALGVREEFAKQELVSYVLAEDAVTYDSRGEDYVRYVATWSKNLRLRGDVLDREVWVAAGGVSALVGIGTREMIDTVTERIDRQLSHAVQVNRFSVEALAGKQRWALVARAAGATKGSALRWLAEKDGVSMTETVCVGDWLNDVPMFSVAGRSFAMGQAPREVKARATDVLDETSKTGGGVARAIERVFGIVAPPG